MNYVEIDAVLDEVQLAGCAIQQVWQPVYDTLIFDCYHPQGSRLILFNFRSGRTRIHASTMKFPTKAAQPRFAVLLRARIKGARIEAVRQVDANRIVEMTLQKDGEIFLFYARLWGSSGNAFLCSPDMSILDCAFRRPGRGEVSGATLELPPPAPGKEFHVRPIPQGVGLSEYLDQSYRELERNERYQQLRQQLERDLQQLENRSMVQIRTLEEQLARISDPERFKYYGDLLMANAHTLPPRAREAVLDDWYQDGGTIRISLDPALNVSANAARWYQKYQKAKESRSWLEDSLGEKQRTLTLVRRLLAELALAADLAALEALRAEVPRRSSDKPAGETGEDFPGVRFQRHGFDVMVGRNANENDALLRRHVRGNDYWLHARDWPGSYVFIRARKDKTPPLDLLLDAAHLAVWYSRGRNAGSADVYYTQVKYLRRAKDGPKGLVIPTQEKNIFVKIDEARLKSLLEA